MSPSIPNSNTFTSDYDYMSRNFADGMNLSAGPAAGTQSPSNTDAAKARFSGIPQNSQSSPFPGVPGFNPPGGLGIDGAAGFASSMSTSARDLNSSMNANTMGMPGMNDIATLYATAAAAGLQNTNNPSAFPSIPMMQQASHQGSNSSGASSTFPPQPTPSSRNQSMPSGQLGQNPQLLNSAFGLMVPQGFATGMPSNNPQFTNNTGNHQQQHQSHQQNGMLSQNGLSGAASPAMQPMSSLPSLSGGGLSDLNNGAAGIPLSPATAFTPAFGSPVMNQAAFAAGLSAASAGVGNMFGIGGFSLPGMSVGGLGMSMPMGSPNMSQQPMNDMNGNNHQQTPVVRTVYVGNLPGDASVDELLSLVRYGPIENVKIIPDKSCAFISFLEPAAAAAFHSDACLRKLSLHGQDLKIGWGKPSTIPAPVLQACQQHGATRNVYLGNLDESFTEQSLRDELSRFGHIDQVKIVRDKNIGFVHFLSIATAIKVVAELPKDPDWAGRRVNYGKDRCAYVPRNQHQQQQHNQMAASMAAQAASQITGFPSPFNPMTPQMPMSPMMSPLAFQGGFADPNMQVGNRTVYLGNLHPDTTTEDICNTIRGGILQEIRYIPDKQICFVTFVLPESALALYQQAVTSGITVKNRRLKVGWGKPSGPCPAGIAAIVATGGSRNVYLGNIDDFETYTVDKIKKDLGQYGEIEQVNLLQEKSCAFTNFTKISSAVKAIEALKQHEEYSKFKIAYGKDRVGNMARAPVIRRNPSHPNRRININDNSHRNGHGNSQRKNGEGPAATAQNTAGEDHREEGLAPAAVKAQEGAGEDASSTAATNVAAPSSTNAAAQLEAANSAAAAVASAESQRSA